MKNNLLIIISVVLALNLLLSLFNYTNSRKVSQISYVRSPDLIYGYEGTKEVQDIYNNKQMLETARLDSLNREYNELVSQIRLTYGELRDKEKKEREAVLNQKKQELYRFSEAIDEKMKEEEERLMQGVLNQINSFVEEYGKQHNIELILGSTNNGNILYGKHYLDITDDVLKALNNNYRQK